MLGSFFFPLLLPDRPIYRQAGDLTVPDSVFSLVNPFNSIVPPSLALSALLPSWHPPARDLQVSFFSLLYYLLQMFPTSWRDKAIVQGIVQGTCCLAIFFLLFFSFLLPVPGTYSTPCSCRHRSLHFTFRWGQGCQLSLALSQRTGKKRPYSGQLAHVQVHDKSHAPVNSDK